MERLTEKISEYIQCNNNECRLSYCDRECEHYKRMVNKLAEYEDAEELGLLLRLPCKVGDTVYALSFSGDEGRWFECVVKTINICSEENYAVAHCEELGLGVTLFFDRFRKTIFLTKEEAGKALEQMKVGAENE